MCGLEEVGLPNEFCLFIQRERERERAAQNEKVVNLRVFAKKRRI